MATRGKQKEIQIQSEIESQEDWEEQISKEGLLVVDVYQDWCGPCRAMLPVFKRIKFESGDEMLRFAVAKADVVEALDKYRGKCEPIFLLYAGGVLVGIVKGADAPVIDRLITEQLAQEHRILESGGMRVEVTQSTTTGWQGKVKASGSSVASDASEVDDEDDLSTDEDEEEERRILIVKEYTVLTVFPGIYNDKMKSTLLNKLKTSGFDVLQESEHEFTTEDASYLMKNITNPEMMEDVIASLISGVSLLLLISKGDLGKNVIQDFREFVGPEGMAREVAPMSLRATIGSKEFPLDGMMCSNFAEEAYSTIQNFFPNFVTQKMSVTHLKPATIWKTIAYMTPPLNENMPANLIGIIQQLGFKVVFKREVTLTEKVLAKMFKGDLWNKYQSELVECFTSGPTLAMMLTNGQRSVITDWLEALGDFENPAMGTLRMKITVPGSGVPALHGSLSERDYEREMRWFFPVEQVLLLIKPAAYPAKDQIMQTMREAGYVVAGRKMFTLTPDHVRSLYEVYKSPYILEPLIADLTKSMSCFLVLSRHAALDRLKEQLGYKTDTSDIPLDFEEVESASLSGLSGSQFGVDALLMEQMRNLVDGDTPNRSSNYMPDLFLNITKVFGESVPKNGIHISDSLEQAEKDISLIFGEVKFDTEGYMKKKKIKRLRICDTTKVLMMSKEEVYEEVSKMPAPVKEERPVDPSAEERMKRTQQEKLLAETKERQKEEARQIFEAKYIDPAADVGRWGARVEYPSPETQCPGPSPSFTFNAAGTKVSIAGFIQAQNATTRSYAKNEDLHKPSKSRSVASHHRSLRALSTKSKSKEDN